MPISSTTYLSTKPGNTAVIFGPKTPLLDVLEDPEASCGVQDAATSGTNSPSSIHSYVNCHLDRVAGRARVEQQLTTHSFHRRGAQHENSSEELAARWFFDRGA